MGLRHALHALLVPWFACGATGSGDATLPPLISYAFTPEQTATLNFTGTSGDSRVLTSTAETACGSSVSGREAIGGLTLVTMKYANQCFTDGRYNNRDYLVEKGTVGAFLAYRINPPSSMNTQFLGSQTHVYFNLSSQESYAVYLLTNGQLNKHSTIPSSSFTAGQFLATGIRVDNLGSATTLLFLPTTTSVPLPASRTVRGIEASECNLASVEAGSLRDVAIVLMKGGQDNCWSDGRYNNLDFRVEYGSLVGSDGSSFAAYRFHPPAVAATEFTSSRTNIYFKTPQKQSYKVASYDSSGVTVAATVSTAAASAGSFVDTSIVVSAMTAPTVFVFLPTAQRFSVWPVLSSTVDAALLGQGDSFSVAAWRYDIPGHAFIPGADWGEGPGTHSGNYGIPKQFYPVARSDGREGIVWQDQTEHTVHMTWLAGDLGSAETWQIWPGSEVLVSATSDGQDQIVLLLISRSTPASKTSSSTVKAIKVNSTFRGDVNSTSGGGVNSTVGGGVLLQKTYDAAKSGLNVHKWSSPGASMAWNVQSGRIGVVLARTMTQGNDGLTHQGAIAFVLDASSLDLLINHGQTSGHSFANSLLLTSDGNFLSMDLGDNYPRGINLQRFNEQSRSKKGFTAYSFKTKHGTTATSPAQRTYPNYTEISTASQTFYKWSNDNYCYTEIAHQGVVEVSDGLLVFFAGERPPLDNSRVGAVLNEARNVGFVKVGKDVSTRTILSSGATETGGFYTFGGSWSAQTNEGVNFLTSFSSLDTSASRLKTADLGSRGILLYWEVWSKTAYGETQMMLVDVHGAQVVSPWALSFPVRLAIQDDLLVAGGKVVAYAGAAGKLVRYEISLASGVTAATTVTATMTTTATSTAPPATTTTGNDTTTVADQVVDTTVTNTLGGDTTTAVGLSAQTTTTVAPSTTTTPLRATVSMTLPAVQGATADQLLAALETPAARAELARTIAAGLGVPADSVVVTTVALTSARRLHTGLQGRRLSAGTLTVGFEVVDADASAVAAVTRLVDTSTQENTRFVSALGPALATAASTDGSSALTSLSAAVISSGVVVSGSDVQSAPHDSNASAAGALAPNSLGLLLGLLLAGRL